MLIVDSLLVYLLNIIIVCSYASRWSVTPLPRGRCMYYTEDFYNPDSFSMLAEAYTGC